MKKNSNTNNKQIEKSIIKNFPGIIYIRKMDFSKEFKYEFLNSYLHERLGLAPGEDVEVSPNGYLGMVHWADRLELSKQIMNSIEDGRPYIEKFRIMLDDCQVKCFSGHSFPIRTEEGFEWVGMLLDTTEKEQALRKLDIILENTAEVVIGVDEKGNITNINSVVYDLLGYARQDLIGKNFASFLSDKDKDKWHEYISHYSSCSKEEGLVDETEKLDLLCKKKDGEEIPLELTVSNINMEGKLSFMMVVKNVSAQKQTLETLKETESMLTTIASALPCVLFTMLITTKEEVRILYLSDGSSDIFGFSPEQAYKGQQKYVSKIFNNYKFNKYRKKLVQSGFLATFDEEMKYPYNDRWLQMKFRPEQMENGDFICHGVVIDISDKREAVEKLNYLAYHDALTDTANRALLSRKLNELIEKSVDESKKIAVLSISPTNFNAFYSIIGHDIGDTLLVKISKIIKRVLGPHNLLAYISSNLFVAVLPDMDNDSEVVEMMEKLAEAFSSPLNIDGQMFDITINIGISIYPDHGEDTNSLLRNSNAALDLAKKDLSDYKFFTQEVAQSIINSVNMRSKLRQALDQGDIVPHFQPQIDIKTGRIVGTEALARWINRSDGSIVSPAVFIPIAEEYGLIDHIAATVMHQACNYNQQWIDRNILSVPVAVNISPRQFRNPRELMRMIEKVLRETGLPPDKLEIEITESSTMTNPKEAEDIIKELLKYGITCSIDDFGTGYSSLSVLKRFPLNKIKIDRSFVIDITRDQNDASIVSATVAMAKALNLKVLAEGVETWDIYKFLREAGCNSIQGYLFSKPLPPDELEAFALNWNPKKVISDIQKADKKDGKK